jgi:hypothetical protein
MRDTARGNELSAAWPWENRHESTERDAEGGDDRQPDAGRQSSVASPCNSLLGRSAEGRGVPVIREKSSSLWSPGSAALLALLLAMACSTIGRPFRSDPATLAKLQIGVTTPADSVRLLGAEPYIKQNLADGTLLWHWQSIAAGAYVGVTDNRLLILQFVSSDSDTWTFARVLHAQNVELPPGMPFGSVAR